ncbi:hypothetical protein DFS34DRAFT_607446 [Phlyctochytrium arcticum]|nr:hypothetical protein DFS34DRAFT_607446 [Phlyctochytrium arcticum]
MSYSTQSDPDGEDYDDIDSPDILDPDEPIDFSNVYALHTFVANLEGQVCVLKGDSLELLDDSNSYWWLVKCIKTDEIGYIPAENVETPFERLARLNKMRNVSVTIVQEQDLEPPAPPPQARRKIFFPEDFVDYIDASEDEDYDEDDDEMSSLPRQSKGQTSKGRNFLSKFLNRASSSKKKDDATANRAAEKPAIANVVEQAQAQGLVAERTNKEPINVLRVYAGNVDLKATFKTVALTKGMTATELLTAALRRFRIPGALPNEYYVSVLHMDSQEKRLGEKDNVYDILDQLQHRGLPGVGDSASVSLVVNSKGGTSSVRMTDENIIKVIINKKLNLFEKNYHLIRIFMYDDADTSGKIRTYKTIGVNSQANVGEIIGLATKKFKLRPASGYNYTLNSIFRGQEILREQNEAIYPILMMAEGTAEDIDFVLRKEWVGQGAAPIALSTSGPGSNSTSLMDDIQSILSSKPAFLEELPAAAYGPDRPKSSQYSTESYDTASINSSTSPPRTDSSDPLYSTIDASMDSPAFSTPSHSRIESDVSRKSSVTSSDYRAPEASMDRQTSNDNRRPSVADSIGSIGSLGRAPRISMRQSSLRYDATTTSQSSLKRPDNNGSYGAQEHSGFEQPKRLSRQYMPDDTLTRQLQQGAQSNGTAAGTHTVPVSATGGGLGRLDYQDPSESMDRPFPTQASTTSYVSHPGRSSRANFETMEEILEEILAGRSHTDRLRMLEAKLQDTIPVPSRISNPPQAPLSATTPRPYDDSGLKDILRSRAASSESAGTIPEPYPQAPLTAASSNASIVTTTTSSGVSGVGNKYQRKASTASVSLSDVYHSLEADLEESLQTTPNPRIPNLGATLNPQSVIVPGQGSSIPPNIFTPTPSFPNPQSTTNLPTGSLTTMYSAQQPIASGPVPVAAPRISSRTTTSPPHSPFTPRRGSLSTGPVAIDRNGPQPNSPFQLRKSKQTSELKSATSSQDPGSGADGKKNFPLLAISTPEERRTLSQQNIQGILNELEPLTLTPSPSSGHSSEVGRRPSLQPGSAQHPRPTSPQPPLSPSRRTVDAEQSSVILGQKRRGSAAALLIDARVQSPPAEQPEDDDQPLKTPDTPVMTRRASINSTSGTPKMERRKPSIVSPLGAFAGAPGSPRIAAQSPSQSTSAFDRGQTSPIRRPSNVGTSPLLSAGTFGSNINQADGHSKDNSGADDSSRRGSQSTSANEDDTMNGSRTSVGDYDSAVVLDKYKEVENMLSSMQRVSIYDWFFFN